VDVCVCKGLNSAEVYDPRVNEWKYVACMSTRRSSVGVGVVTGMSSLSLHREQCKNGSKCHGYFSPPGAPRCYFSRAKHHGKIHIDSIVCAKTAELIEMPFGLWTLVGERKHMLDRTQIMHAKRILLGERIYRGMLDTLP